MLSRRSIGRLVLAAALGAIPMSVACGGKAVLDGGGVGGSGADPGPSPVGGGPSGGGGKPVAYDGVVVGDGQLTMAFASYSLTCSNPDPPLPDPCDYWKLDVRLDASMLVPGILNFSDPKVDGFSSYGSSSSGSCSGGGGSFMGELEILSVTASDVVVSLKGTEIMEIPSGKYTAERCP